MPKEYECSEDLLYFGPEKKKKNIYNYINSDNRLFGNNPNMEKYHKTEKTDDKEISYTDIFEKYVSETVDIEEKTKKPDHSFVCTGKEMGKYLEKTRTAENYAIDNDFERRIDEIFRGTIDNLYAAFDIEPDEVKEANEKLIGKIKAFQTLKGRKKKNAEKEILEILHDKHEISEQNADILLNLENLDFLKLLSRIKRKTGMEEDDFIELFSDENAVEKYNNEFEKSFGLTDSYHKYNKKYSLEGEELSQENFEEANQILYNQGMGIIFGILKGDKLISYDYVDDTIQEHIENIRTLSKKIGEEKRSGKDAKELIEEKDKILAKMEVHKRNQIIELLPKEEPNMDKLKEVLNQLSQHYLTGKSKEKADYISRNLKVSIDDTIGSVELEVWDKNIETISTYDDYRCCGFLNASFGNGSAIARYMTDASVQLLHIMADDKEAMAITVATEDENKKKVLLIDSVESDTHIFSRKDVSKTAVKAIDDYAKEAGFDYVIYSTNPGNTAPVEFVEHLDGDVEEVDLIIDDEIFLEYEGEGIIHELGVSA